MATADELPQMTIYTCGSNPKLKGPPDDVPDAVTIDAGVLPNPYSTLGLRARDDLGEVKAFLLKRAAKKVTRLVARGVAAVRQKKPVIVQCRFGRHRSRAIAEMIQAALPSDRVVIVHRESD